MFAVEAAVSATYSGPSAAGGKGWLRGSSQGVSACPANPAAGRVNPAGTPPGKAAQTAGLSSKADCNLQVVQTFEALWRMLDCVRRSAASPQKLHNLQAAVGSCLAAAGAWCPVVCCTAADQAMTTAKQGKNDMHLLRESLRAPMGLSAFMTD